MKWLAALVVLAGCFDAVDAEWQLDHDRIVAVRANPPHIPSGASSSFDALIAHRGGPTDIEQPLLATVADPKDLSAIVTNDLSSGKVIVTAPDAATLAAERAELGLDPAAPVPVDVVMQFPTSNGIQLYAKKTVYLGDSADNPASIGTVTVNGDTPAPGAAISIPVDVDVPLATDADPADKVMWLTSCGTMHDDNELAAFIHVLPADPKQGELAFVLRDTAGGVVWQVWPISAE